MNSDIEMISTEKGQCVYGRQWRAREKPNRRFKFEYWDARVRWSKEPPVLHLLLLSNGSDAVAIAWARSIRFNVLDTPSPSLDQQQQQKLSTVDLQKSFWIVNLPVMFPSFNKSNHFCYSIYLSLIYLNFSWFHSLPTQNAGPLRILKL